MKTKKANKKAISLIVLVITIIVMIILAGAIIISLNNAGIIGKANEAVAATNLKQVEHIAALAWADAYMDGARDVDELKDAVDRALEDAKVDVTKYEITVTTKGVIVKAKDTTTPPVTEPEETAPTQLSKPTISISGDTLAITDNVANGSYTARFEVYIGSEKKATITASSATTFDITTLELEAGTYSITVKSVAAEGTTIAASEPSDAVEYVVEKTATTLGALVASAENYGDTVNYTVTVNEGTEEETTIKDWKVFYKQTVQDKTTGKSEEYVYLIASEKLVSSALPTNIPGATRGTSEVTIEGKKKTLGNIYWSTSSDVPTEPASGTINKDLWLANWNDGIYNTNQNAICVSYFLDETYWTAFKNDTDYKDASGNSYVKGAIGTPTAEMFVASWNAKREMAIANGDTETYNKKLSLVENGTRGYWVNDITESDPASSDTGEQSIATKDDLYTWSTTSNTSCWLASPSASYTNILLYVYFAGRVGYNGYNASNYGVRPVVCLKASIPAYAQGEGDTTDIVLAVD